MCSVLAMDCFGGLELPFDMAQARPDVEKPGAGLADRRVLRARLGHDDRLLDHGLGPGHLRGRHRVLVLLPLLRARHAVEGHLRGFLLADGGGDGAELVRAEVVPGGEVRVQGGEQDRALLGDVLPRAGDQR